MSVWVLVAVMRVPEVVGGHLTEFVAVYASAAACEHVRTEIQRGDKDVEWKCLREEPKQ
jgi:hypothetical protein